MLTRGRLDFMAEGGEMGALMRSKDWTKTSLGDPATWPQSLKTILGVILHSKFPMFVWWGPELISFYNDAYRPSLGNDGKHPSILGQPAKKAWPEIWDIISPLIEQVMGGGEASWSEDQLIPIFRNGRMEDVYWTFSYSRISNEEGKPYGVLVTCVETTQKMQSQQLLADSNDLLRFSTEAAELGTWDYNPLSGKFLANNRLKEWFGLLPEAETDLQIAINAIADKDRERVVKAIAAAIDYAIRAPYDIEYTIVHPESKKERVVLVRGKPFFNEENIAYRFSGTMEDVTEQAIARQKIQEAEERARLAVEAGNLGTFDYDFVRKKTIVSDRLAEIFDVPPGAVQEELVKNIHPDDRIIREKALERAKETGDLFYEVRILRQDGSINWARLEGKLIRDEAGNALRMLGTGLDFTEKKELEQKREEYIAIASHELRNPLTSLKLSLDLVTAQLKTPESAFLVNKSKEQVKRLISMTNELLNVSKISAGVLDLKPEIFNLQDSIRESIATVQGGTDKNSYTIMGQADISVQADKFRIEQVMVNLISNASKYSPKGSAIVIAVSEDTRFVKVEVRDKGIGIDADKVHTIFKKFSRIDGTGAIEGYGLGLYISEQIISKHGGSMGLETEKGKGSAFWFTLPR